MLLLQESTKQASKVILFLMAFALIGFKDTGIFVNNFSTSLNNGSQVNYEINDRVRIIGEGASKTTYKVLDQDQEIFVPKADLLRVTKGTKGYYVDQNTSLVDQNGNVIRLLFIDEYLDIVEERQDTVVVTAQKDGSTGIVNKSDLRADTIRHITEGRILEDTSITNDQGLTLELKAGDSVDVAWHQKDFFILFDQDQNKFNVNTNLVDIFPQEKKENNELGQVETAEPVTNGPLADQIIVKAKGHLGRPYVWGDSGDKGFDCSGLVYSVYKDIAGITLPRRSVDMGKQGSNVSKENLEKGDLLFFNDGNGGQTNHVAIYIGDNQMIHASNSQRGVVIDPTTGYYFQNNFTHAQRIIK